MQQKFMCAAYRRMQSQYSCPSVRRSSCGASMFRDCARTLDLRLRSTARLFTFAFALSLFSVSAGGEDSASRNDRFQQEIWVPAESLIVGEDTTLNVGVIIRNGSRYVWPNKGANPVQLSYHWLNYRGEIEIFEGTRMPLPNNLRPQESVFLMAVVKAPQKTGRFILRMTMVQEGIAWFEDRGGIPADVYVDVISAR